METVKKKKKTEKLPNYWVIQVLQFAKGNRTRGTNYKNIQENIMNRAVKIYAVLIIWVSQDVLMD